MSAFCGGISEIRYLPSGNRRNFIVPSGKSTAQTAAYHLARLGAVRSSILLNGYKGWRRAHPTYRQNSGLISPKTWRIELLYFKHTDNIGFDNTSLMSLFFLFLHHNLMPSEHFSPFDLTLKLLHTILEHLQSRFPSPRMENNVGKARAM